MFDFLGNEAVWSWAAVSISFIALILSIVSMVWKWRSDIRLQRVEEINEENRQRNMLIQNFLSEQNNRALVVPYFNIVLKDERIKKEDNSLILEIGLVNIGKESATNIQLVPKFSDELLSGYFDSQGYPKRQYRIYEYLSQYYAVPGEEVLFKIKLELKNEEKVSDFMLFKIKYFDLLGYEYEQDFRFGFFWFGFNGLNDAAYNLNNSSYKPIVLKK